MLSIIEFLPILVLFIFLNHSIHAYAGNPLPPHSAYDHLAIDSTRRYSTPIASKLRKQVFCSVNTWMTGVVIILTVLNIVVYKLREIHEENLREKYKPSQQSCRRFLLADILSATKMFDNSLVVGEGGFGKVYRGVIDDGAITVAIKRLNPRSKQGAPEFWSEIEMLSTIRHTNVVSLIGFCDDCDEMILVYDYMVRGTLAHNIHINRRQSALPWSQRLKICIGAAHGLDYLHTGTGEQNRIIHRDVKSSNILLSENWTAKVSDFGLSKIGPTNQLHSHVSTNVKGTFGYMDPEYYLTHQLTRKSDVYAFGVVLFEVLCGRRAVDLSLDVEQRSLAGWAQDCIKEGKLVQIIDPSLRGQILSDSLTVFAQIADQCLHMFSTKRPTMAEVVVALELALTKQERTDFSFDEEFSMNTGGDSDNLENGESSIRAEVVINESHGALRTAESSVRTEVINNESHGTLRESSARTEVVNNESHGTHRRRRALTKNVWKFFFGTGHMISGGDLQVLRETSSRKEEGYRVKHRTDDREGRTMLIDKQVNGSVRLHGEKSEKKWAKAKYQHGLGGSIPKALEGEQVAAGWPSWLAAVAGEAIRGWLPRRADSFKKLDKIGQGTCSDVYRAHDLDHGKIVALKKVRFDHLQPESVHFMAREILILRKLDHPNIIKLEGLVTSRLSGSLYLIFESMEHDLAGLASHPGLKFTESQVKCYMQQLLRGLDHCHSHDILHRDIKGSNILMDNSGILKIADFGSACLYIPQQGVRTVPLTSRVGTLWYRAPELLLGATDYGTTVDLWSTGCLLAELYARKPIMPGRTEVEQLNKIFKLCGSPSEDYWRKSKFPHTTIFKPQEPYRRVVMETFKDFPRPALSLLEILLSIDPAGRGSAASALKNEFFSTEPLPCDPSSLPKNPLREFDAKSLDRRLIELHTFKGHVESVVKLKGLNIEVSQQHYTI